MTTATADESTFDHFLRRAVDDVGLGTVASWSSARHRRRSTYRLDAVDVELVTGRSLHLVRKSTSTDLIVPAHRGSRSGSEHDPRREHWAYEHLLGPLDTGTPTWIGSEPTQRWLLLEAVDGQPLTESGDPDRWASGARWFADFHRLASATPRDPVLQHDAHACERRWVAAVAAAPWPIVVELLALRSAVEMACEILDGEPHVVIHGEAFPSNVVVETATGRLAVVDWETVGLGPAALDLAAYTAGWSPVRARELVAEYGRAAGDSTPGDRARRELTWAAGRVVVAVAQLARASADPIERRHDWLAELGDAAEHLGSLGVAA